MNNNKNPKVGWHIGSNPKSLPIYKSHQTPNQDFMFDEMSFHHTGEAGNFLMMKLPVRYDVRKLNWEILDVSAAVCFQVESLFWD